MPLKTSFYLKFSSLSNKFQGGQQYFSLKSNRLKFLSTFVGMCKISFDGFVLSAPLLQLVHFWLLRHCQNKKPNKKKPIEINHHQTNLIKKTKQEQPKTHTNVVPFGSSHYKGVLQKSSEV